MERAVKLALVDPRHLEYRDLAKSFEGQAKADLSMEMRRILDDATMPDDVKIKMYKQTLDRFLKVGDKIVDKPLPPINYLSRQRPRPPPPPPSPTPPPTPVKVTTSERRSDRKSKTPWSRF